MSDAPHSGPTYYGTTAFGHRIHFGEIVLFPEANDPDKWVVAAHCGARLTERDIDAPLPNKVDEYCRVCFRALAWQAFEQSLLSAARSRMRQERLGNTSATPIRRTTRGRELAQV